VRLKDVIKFRLRMFGLTEKLRLYRQESCQFAADFRFVHFPSRRDKKILLRNQLRRLLHHRVRRLMDLSRTLARRIDALVGFYGGA
jgi:hypothetical protein